ncbi:CAP domain-containing protein [Sphingomonas sp. SUN039]|uniref:CAP domain-containing protein n=1 Tax=Sphingomonas sp. SUN039 TaxID=2937787 RepID=UPI0021644CCE|nr:CAP domain-containing protein [Sphingomonas sp. SUN039]UVO54042.1 CAP domain-containing protein [Sphingomonas sp. SUN039]
MMIRALLTSLALLTPLAVSAQVQSYTQEWDGKAAPRSDAAMRAAMLVSHNRARAAFGSMPLVWNDALAANALAYARVLARENRFGHDPQKGAKVRQGENLWVGTRGAFDYAAMAASWVDERKDFKPGRFPDVSRTGNWGVVGHYTQIVWPASASVGCGLASNADDDFLVCRYLSAGNVYGSDLRPVVVVVPRKP